MSRRLLPLATPVLAVVLASLLVLASTTSRVWLVGAVVLLVQGVVAAGPAAPGLRTYAAPRVAPVMAAGLVATVATVRPSLLAGAEGSAAGGDLRLDSGVLIGLPLGIAVGVALTLLGQMLRGEHRPSLVDTAADTVAAVAMAALAVGWISAVQSSGVEIIVIGAVGLAVASLVWAVPGDRFLIGSAAAAAAFVAGGAVPLLLDGPGTPLLGVAVGGAAGMSALLGLVAGTAWAAGREDTPDGIGLRAGIAVALAGPAVHVGAQLVTLAL